jgi:hypothetical protein
MIHLKTEEFRADRSKWCMEPEVELSFGAKDPDGMWMIAQPLVMKTHEPGTIITPFMSVKLDTAQQLMDQLWRCGVRPADGTGSTGQLAATERHLADMRALVPGLIK